MRIRHSSSSPAWRRAACRLAAACAVALSAAEAQEAVRPSLARETSEQITIQPAIYNLKAGPVFFRVSASLRAEYVDNINLTNGHDSPREADFILAPALDLDVSWTISRLNTLRLHTQLGYTKYLSHSELDSSTVTFSPDSILKLNVYTGDFRFTLRDQFSYQEDPIGEGAVSNVAKFSRFTNDVGLDILWDLNDIIASFSYDHTNFIVTEVQNTNGQTSSDLNQLDHTIDQFSLSALFHFNSVLDVGLEGTASNVSFPDFSSADYSQVTIGPFLSAQLTRYTKLYASGGYQRLFGSDTGHNNEDSHGGGDNASADSFYAHLTLSNRLNRFVVDELTLGHENEVGLFSQRSERTFASLTARYQIFPQLAISSTVRFEDTDESGTLLLVGGRSASRHYEQFLFTIGTSYQLTRKLSVSLGYQFTERFDKSGEHDDAQFQSLDYTQNRVTLVLGYQF